jgi:hypothetical protein
MALPVKYVPDKSDNERRMFSLKPGTTAIIIGACTAAGRANIGKSVELLPD